MQLSLIQSGYFSQSIAFPQPVVEKGKRELSVLKTISSACFLSLMEHGGQGKIGVQKNPSCMCMEGLSCTSRNWLGVEMLRRLIYSGEAYASAANNVAISLLGATL